MKEAHARSSSSSQDSRAEAPSSTSPSSSSNKGDARDRAIWPEGGRRAGGAKKKKKRSERGGEVFKEDWDASEDTSRKEMNPLYADRMQLKLLFGRGKMAGLDEGFGNESSSSSRSSNSSSNSNSNKGMQGKSKEQHWSEKRLDDMNERDWRIFREDFDIRVQAHGGLKNMTQPLRNWEEGSFPEHVNKAIQAVGYKNPSPIQRQAIPSFTRPSVTSSASQKPVRARRRHFWCPCCAI